MRVPGRRIADARRVRETGCMSCVEHLPAGRGAVDVRGGGRKYQIYAPHAATDYIQSALVRTGHPYEEAMLDVMAGVLRPGELVLDVGANVGNHTLYLAVVAQCHVVAYEPNPELAAAIRTSVQLNDLDDRVTVREVGVHSRRGRGSMENLNPSNLGAQSISVDPQDGEFDVVALDDEEQAGRVALIKVDVEGAELAVLQGARVLLQRDRPLLFVECGSVKEFRDVAAFLTDLGYSMQGTYNETPTHAFAPIPDTEADRAVNRGFIETTVALYDLRSQRRRLRTKATRLQEELVALKRRSAKERYRIATLRAENAELQAELKKARERIVELVAEAQAVNARDQGGLEL